MPPIQTHSSFVNQRKMFCAHAGANGGGGLALRIKDDKIDCRSELVVARGWCSQRPPHHAVAKFQEQAVWGDRLAVWGGMILFLTSTDIHRYKKKTKTI